jgi:hypothetical protein
VKLRSFLGALLVALLFVAVGQTSLAQVPTLTPLDGPTVKNEPDPGPVEPKCKPTTSEHAWVQGRPYQWSTWQNVGAFGRPVYFEPKWGVTMVPVRNLTNTLGPDASAGWNNAERIATFTFRQRVLSIHFPKGSLQAEKAFLDGLPYRFTTTPFICDGAVFASVFWVADGLFLDSRVYNGRNVTVEPFK